MGYTKSSSTFRIYIPSKRFVLITRQVTFPIAKSGEVNVEFMRPSIQSYIPSSNTEAISASNPLHNLPLSPLSNKVSENLVETPRPSLPVSSNMPGNFVETPQLL